MEEREEIGLVKFLLRVLGVLLLAVALGAGALYYAFRIEPGMLVTREYDLAGEGADAWKVVQLSDLELSPSYDTTQLDRLVEEVNRQQPDLLVFTGDLFHNYAQYAPVDEVTDALSRMEAPAKLAVWGNRDYGGGAQWVYPQVMEAAGFTLLCNSGVTLDAGGQTVYVAGLDDGLLGAPYPQSALEGRPADASYTILLFHEPDLAAHAEGQGVDLMLAGHTHGGQVRLPFVEPVTTSLGERYIRGLYPLSDGGQLYVHSGLGTSRLPVRFLVPPQVAVFLVPASGN